MRYMTTKVATTRRVDEPVDDLGRSHGMVLVRYFKLVRERDGG